MRDEKEAYQLFDLFQWAMDDGWACIEIKTFFSKYPFGKKQTWQAFLGKYGQDEKYLIEGFSIDELYKNTEQYFLSGKGKVKRITLEDIDLL